MFHLPHALRHIKETSPSTSMGPLLLAHCIDSTIERTKNKISCPTCRQSSTIFDIKPNFAINTILHTIMCEDCGIQLKKCSCCHCSKVRCHQCHEIHESELCNELQHELGQLIKGATEACKLFSEDTFLQREQARKVKAKELLKSDVLKFHKSIDNYEKNIEKEIDRLSSENVIVHTNLGSVLRHDLNKTITLLDRFKADMSSINIAKLREECSKTTDEIKDRLSRVPKVLLYEYSSSNLGDEVAKLLGKIKIVGNELFKYLSDQSDGNNSKNSDMETGSGVDAKKVDSEMANSKMAAWRRILKAKRRVVSTSTNKSDFD